MRSGSNSPGGAVERAAPNPGGGYLFKERDLGYYFEMASSSRRRVRRRETTQSRAPADQATLTMPSTVTIGI
jgi:hypothetical protein